MVETIFNGIIALILVGVLVALLFVLIKIDNQRYKEHKEFKDNILKEIRRFNDFTSKPIDIENTEAE